MMKENTSSKCRNFLLSIKDDPAYIDGHLSIEMGFLPINPPEEKLPPPFDCWDAMAREIPTLYFSNNTQQQLQEMPVLDANGLDAALLPRASLVLSILAFAYWRQGIDNVFAVRTNMEEGFLPPSILTPWRQVSERLQRGPDPYQSICDLFFNNFKLKDGLPYEPSSFIIENLDVLVPSFNNMPEKVFYMSFVEMAATTPTLIDDICEIEETILSHRDQHLINQQLIVLLQKIARDIRRCSRVILKVSPDNKSKTYCDPILWSKTVAAFSVPPANFIQGGSSGASLPLTHVMDALIGRIRYNSFYGKAVKTTGNALLPRKVKEFVVHVKGIQLREYITHLSNDFLSYQPLTEAYNELIESYAGCDGFLMTHASKALNYLCVSTMVGRNQSISGHNQYIRTESWQEACEELKITASERERIPATS